MRVLADVAGEALDVVVAVLVDAPEGNALAVVPAAPPASSELASHAAMGTRQRAKGVREKARKADVRVIKRALASFGPPPPSRTVITDLTKITHT